MKNLAVRYKMRGADSGVSLHVQEGCYADIKFFL